MRFSFYKLLGFTVLLGLTACSSIGLQPMTRAGLLPSDRPLKPSIQFKALERAEASDSFFYGATDVVMHHNRLIEKMLSEHKADALVKVSWQSNTYDIVLFQWHSVTLRATPVRFTNETKQ